MRLKPKFIFLSMILMLVIGYQNFSNVEPGEWDTARTLQIMKEMSEFEKNNPQKAVIATPQGGSDFKSVSNDWMNRQGAIILNGYDKKLESAMNEKLNSWVREITRKDYTDEEINVKISNDGKGSETGVSISTEESRRRKQNLRFTRVNQLKYDLGENTCLDLTADPGNTHLNYSQTLSSNSKMGFEHRLSDNTTQMMFKYEW